MPLVYITVGLATEKEIDQVILNKIAEDAGKYAYGVLADNHLTGKETQMVAHAHEHTSSSRYACDFCRNQAADEMTDNL